MRYRVFLSVEVDASDDKGAHESAVSLSEMLKDPMVKIGVQMKGIRLAGDDGRITVYQPERVG